MKRRKFLTMTALATIGLPLAVKAAETSYQAEDFKSAFYANDKFDSLSSESKKKFISYLRDRKKLETVAIRETGEPLMNEVADILGEMAGFFERRMREVLG